MWRSYLKVLYPTQNEVSTLAGTFCKRKSKWTKNIRLIATRLSAIVI